MEGIGVGIGTAKDDGGDMMRRRAFEGIDRGIGRGTDMRGGGRGRGAMRGRGTMTVPLDGREEATRLIRIDGGVRGRGTVIAEDSMVLAIDFFNHY